jgi:hypothetical protein
VQRDRHRLGGSLVSRSAPTRGLVILRQTFVRRCKKIVSRRLGREPADYRPPAVAEPPAPSIMSRRTAAPVAEVAPSPPRPQPPAVSDWRYVWATVERPSETNPGGAIVEGHYRTAGDLVEVKDMAGNALGVVSVSDAGHAEAAARKILREKKASEFYDPLPYRPPSVH